MSTNQDVRARRPKGYEGLMLELQNEAHFPSYRDVLLFAAAVGFQQGRRAAFTESIGDPIRYEVLINSQYAETLVNMIAANVVNDPEILGDDRLEERIRVFEEYANGGLEYIQEQCNVRRQNATTVVTDLVADALADAGPSRSVSVEELLDIGW